MSENQMREVVERLDLERSEALLELFEFVCALDEFLNALEASSTGSQRLHASALAVRAPDHPRDYARVTDLQEQAARGSANASQILVAFRQLHGAVKLWNVAEARMLSNAHKSAENPPE